MSGTSLDGLDIIACRFEKKSNTYNYDILYTETIPYTQKWIKLLNSSTQLSGLELTKLHHDLGKYYGHKVNAFIKNNEIDKSEIGFIASHGHTVFHQPEKGFTLQIGHGANIAYETGIQTIADFRIENVIRGGQGAPLVPIGDQLLFADYDACINLGGFCNISFQKNGQRIAFDIAPCNLPLNNLSKLWGMEFDKNGAIAAQGEINSKLLEQLNQIDYYKKKAPKSLGTEWLNDTFYTYFDNRKDPKLMKTLVEHITDQIKMVIHQENLKNVLITGGGAYNTTLIESLKMKTNAQITIPSVDLIEFKEALIFAFLGWCKTQQVNNVLSSVTGSKTDGCHGILFEP